MQVNFPPDHWIPAAKLSKLEKLLPPRPPEEMSSDDAEEVRELILPDGRSWGHACNHIQFISTLTVTNWSLSVFYVLLSTLLPSAHTTPISTHYSHQHTIFSSAHATPISTHYSHQHTLLPSAHTTPISTHYSYQHTIFSSAHTTPTITPAPISTCTLCSVVPLFSLTPLTVCYCVHVMCSQYDRLVTVPYKSIAVLWFSLSLVCCVCSYVCTSYICFV